MIRREVAKTLVAPKVSLFILDKAATSEHN
jgi:hypothetical protein